MDGGDLVKGARDAIQSNGRRLTQQRALLLELIEGANGHLDADEIYRLAKERDERISLSTVYRTLSLLKRLDLVAELHFSENHHHYEPKSETEHYHLVCLSCGQVTEFHLPIADSIHRTLAERYSFEVTSTSIDVSGYCHQCRPGRPQDSATTERSS
jgi:Fur family ferric uptake transcriptional regulator